MTTIKTCTIPDEYKHVVYKDLENYLTKEDLYSYKYTDAEKRQIIANLGIDEVTKIDDKLIPYSNNPVSGGTLFNELNKKADLQVLQPIVKDVQKLKGKLPHGLILRKGDTATYYDTTKDVQVTIPTKISDLENDTTIDIPFVYSGVISPGQKLQFAEDTVGKVTLWDAYDESTEGLMGNIKEILIGFNEDGHPQGGPSGIFKILRGASINDNSAPDVNIIVEVSNNKVIAYGDISKVYYTCTVNKAPSIIIG